MPPTEEKILAHGFDWWDPKLLTPGGFAVISHNTTSKKFNEFLNNPQKRFWYVKAVLGGETLFPPVFGPTPISVLRKGEGEMFASTFPSRVSEYALSFKPIANTTGQIFGFGLYVQADDPAKALEDAREPFGELLDSITSTEGAPLRYTQFSVSENEIDHPLAFEIHIPYPNQLLIEKGQFLPDMHPLFRVSEALVREGICSESPYYRLLCAYRVGESITKIGRAVTNVATAKGKTHLIPDLPKIPAREIEDRGAHLFRSDAERQSVGPDRVFDLEELFKFKYWKDKRDTVSHFFVDLDEGGNESGKRKKKSERIMISPSIGRNYRDFSLTAAILLYYSRLHLLEMKNFCLGQLDPRPLFVGKMYGDDDPKYGGALLMAPRNPLRDV
jgi:hypothetical protein